MTFDVCKLSLHCVQRKIHEMLLNGELLPEDTVAADTDNCCDSFQHGDCWDSQRIEVKRNDIIRDIILSGRKIS